MPETAEGVLEQPIDADQVESATWVQSITERIVQNFDPLRIILFGSHARDEAGSESDIFSSFCQTSLINARPPLRYGVRLRIFR